MMSVDQCRFTDASARVWVSYKARESKMMIDGRVTNVTESTCCFTFGRDSVVSQASETTCCFTYGRETVTERLSVSEGPDEESMTVNSHHTSRASVMSSVPPPRARKSYVSTEELVALQTCTNSLQFKTQRFGQEEGGRARSASFSLPNRNSSRDLTDDESMSTVYWKFNFGRRGGAYPRIRKMPLREYQAMEEEERRWNFSKTDRVVRTEQVPEEARTTVMMRGIPKEYTRDALLHLLQAHDFGDINFLYLLMNLNTGLSAGYCFINFRFPEDAMEFKSAFTGSHVFSAGPEARPEDAVSVQWRSPIQGFASHVDRLKNSYYLTQANYPSQFKPTVIRDGKEVRFPPQVWGKVCRIQKVQRYMRRREKALQSLSNIQE